MFPHIAYFQAGYPVPDGTTTAVHGLAFGLAERGFRVTIYGCGPRHELDRLPSHPNLHVQLFPRLTLGGFSVPRSLIRGLERNQENIDLLVINTMFNPPNVAVARAATNGGIPYVVSPHDPYHNQLLSKNRFRKKVYSALFERPLLRRAAAVQVLAADHARWLDPFGVRIALVIPNGFHATDMDDLPQQPHGREIELRGNPRFLCLGRLDAHHKGLDLLIRGFASALHSGLLPESATINFVGRGNGDREVLRQLAVAENAADHVNFFGEVPDQTRSAILRECDVLLLCSRYDGFGLVALEAMLAAKPVMVSREAGISRWVEKAEAGIIAEPSVTGIRAALSECMRRRSEWTVLGQNGRSYARRHLTWDQVAEHAARCYCELLRLVRCPATVQAPIHVIDFQEADPSKGGDAIEHRQSDCRVTSGHTGRR